MCLIALAYRQHPDFPLLVIANRDEYHARPSRRLHFWDEGFYAGRDQQAGGTWLGLRPDGRFAALTNVRENGTPTGRRSRGELVVQALRHDGLFQPRATAGDYSGYNLLHGFWRNGHYELHYSSNRFSAQSLAPGIYGLSNGELDSSWPKVQIAKHALSEHLYAALTDKKIPSSDWLDALQNRDAANDDTLPDTGIGLAKERWLSPCFIVSPGYGTVSSHWVAVGQQNAEIAEVRYDEQGRPNETGHFLC